MRAGGEKRLDLEKESRWSDLGRHRSGPCEPGPSWEGEIKGRPGVHAALGPNPAAVSLHDALDGGEPDSSSRELFGAMQTLERREELGGEGHVEASAVVSNVEG